MNYEHMTVDELLRCAEPKSQLEAALIRAVEDALRRAEVAESEARSCNDFDECEECDDLRYELQEYKKERRRELAAKKGIIEKLAQACGDL